MPDDDLAELLGNLLENACKWASGIVEIRVAPSHATTSIFIGDDGPGVAEDRMTDLGRRGLRLDQSKAGSGLGLAIVGDICAAYGGDIAFERCELGGLGVNVTLPAKQRQSPQ